MGSDIDSFGTVENLSLDSCRVLRGSRYWPLPDHPLTCSFRPKVDVSEGSFRPLEIFFPKTKFPPAGQELAGDGTQGPVGTAFRPVALEEDRYAQCV